MFPYENGRLSIDRIIHSKGDSTLETTHLHATRGLYEIILIGASGGKGIDKELGERHDIVRVGHSSGDFQVDISDADSIRALFEKTGRFDALVAAVGKVHFGALEEMGEAQYQLGCATS